MNRLTDKQQRFCQEYIVDMNATEAAVRAGYSAHTAKQQGHRLLKYPCVQSRD
jgi:phage terminase small subunit